MDELTLSPLVFTDAKIGGDEAKLTIDALPQLRRPDPGVSIAAPLRLSQHGKGDRAAKSLAPQRRRRGHIVHAGNAASQEQGGGRHRQIVQIANVVRRGSVRPKTLAGISVIVD